MIPIYLDPNVVRCGVVGRDRLCLRRFEWLVGLGAEPLVFSDAPSPALRERAGAALRTHLPAETDIKELGALWVADLTEAEQNMYCETARRLGVLVNVEDRKEHCDFHTPAVVRRGRLLLAAGTGGASPAAAAIVRERLEAAFGAEWAVALEELSQVRETMREAGADLREITEDARARLRRLGLIP